MKTNITSICCAILVFTYCTLAHADETSHLIGDWMNDQGDRFQIRLADPDQEQVKEENPNDYIWRSDAGAKGNSYDPDTGVQINSIDQGDGTILVTTTDPDGHQTIRTRPAVNRFKVDKRQFRLQQAQQELALYLPERYYQWTNIATKEVIKQKEYSPLAEPFQYEGEHYSTVDIDQKVAVLKKEIAKLTAKPPLKPVERNDPIEYNQNVNDDLATPVIIHVEQKNPPHSYDFQQAYIDDDIVYARRTIMDTRDISGLPEGIANDLVARWSPPEWYQLEFQINPETGTPELQGNVWRMHVSYTPDNPDQVTRMHSPFAKPIVLKRVRTINLQGIRPQVVEHKIIDHIEVTPDDIVRVHFKTDLQTPPTETSLD